MKAAPQNSTLPAIQQLIATQADLSPQNEAILAPGLRSPLTYQRLQQHLLETGQNLNKMGIGRGDRLAIVLPNGPEMATAFLAVSACSTSAPLNPSYRAAEFDFYLSDLEVDGLLCLQGLHSPAITSAKKLSIPIIELVPDEDVAGLFSLSGAARVLKSQSGFAEEKDTALLLHTSGTTSRPKIVPLTQLNMTISAENIRQTLRLTGQDRCLNIMPLFHIHGLMAAILASMAAGAGVVCSPGFYAPQFFEWLHVFQPTWYTAVPSMHQSILRFAGENQAILERTRLRFVRTSSASLPPQVLEELERVFKAPVIEAYGMTEACHQMSSNPLPPLVRKPGTVGPEAGPEMGIMAEASDNLLATHQVGEIVIRGGNVTSGYLNNPQGNAAAFSNGWLRTGDQGFMDEDGYFFITGRLKELINRGGEKISPREIDEVLMDHPGVEQALAFSVPDDILGEAVAAAVVLRDHNLTEAELRRFAASRLADFKVPTRIVILKEIPRGPTGKLQRIGLAEKLGIQAVSTRKATTTGEKIAPRSETEEHLLEIWQEVLNGREFGVTQPFLELGGDSMLATQILARMENSFDLQISMLDFFDAPTIAEQAELVETLILDQLEDLSDDEAAQQLCD
jgi:acyl-CoA synthetase (AMP-forming)/AMP-acid ligase II/acyl carrier protein